MTTPTNPHLAKAAEYIGKGEAFYHKAAAEIIAAQADDPTLGYRVIGAALGKTDKWCRDIVRWHTTADVTGRATPYAGEGDRVMKSHTRSTLTRATPDEVRAIVADLPPEAKANLAGAIVDDPEARRAHTRAAIDHQRAAETQVDAAQAERAPRLVHDAGWLDAAGAMLKARRMYAEALDAARRVDLADDERAALTQTNDEMGRIHGWFASYLASGAGSFDTELAALLEEGR